MVLSLFFAMCKQKNAKREDTLVKRDTTIKVSNAFTNLFLDSLKVEKYIINKTPVDSIARQIRNFYNIRNYEFAWFTEEGLAEHTRAFWNLHNNYVNDIKDSAIIDLRLHKRMEILLEEDSTITFDSSDITEMELLLTEHFLNFSKYTYHGIIDPEELQWHIPRKKINPVILLDSLILSKGRNLEAWEPLHPQFKLVKNQLTRYLNIESSGGWDEIGQTKKRYREGDSNAVVKKIKHRLYMTGDLTNEDTSIYFNNGLLSAVRTAQGRFGLKQTGIVNDELIKELDVPVKNRILQLLINMERMRWLPAQPGKKLVVANIPEFKLHVFEDGNEIFAIDIVVGREANKTVIFSDELKYVVFSPYWNVPRSIVRNEIVPALRNNPNYLRRNNMEQTGTSNGLPVIRQRPGGNNALGRVKFIFPNTYNIYFHDTPAKSLFQKQQRAFSHGCIRLANPQKFAEYLLKDKPEWTGEKIRNAMYADREKWVPLDETVPVFITYFTAWVDHEGKLNFRDDIYRRDKEMADRIFERP